MASVAKQGEAWLVRYTDAAGKQRAKSFKLKRDAEAHRTKVDHELRTGMHVAPTSSVTFDKLCELFLEHAEQRKRNGEIGGSRLSNLRKAVINHFKPVLGKRNVAQLGRADFEEVAISLYRTKGLRPIVASQYLGALALIIDFAVRRNMIALNRVREVRKEYGGRREEVLTFSREEIKAILVAIETLDETPGELRFKERRRSILRAAVYLAAFCGMRWGEIFGLHWCDLDLDGGQLHLHRSLSRLDGLKGPKTRAGIRDLPIPAVVVAALREWQERAGGTVDGLVFRSTRGTPIKPEKFHYVWRAALKRAGLDERDDKGRGRHFHALRHFAASAMIEAGTSLPEVAELLGHSNPSVTMTIYAHALGSQKKRAATLEGIVSSVSFPALPSPDCKETAIAA